MQVASTQYHVYSAPHRREAEHAQLLDAFHRQIPSPAPAKLLLSHVATCHLGEQDGLRVTTSLLGIWSDKGPQSLFVYHASTGASLAHSVFCIESAEKHWGGSLAQTATRDWLRQTVDLTRGVSAGQGEGLAFVLRSLSLLQAPNNLDEMLVRDVLLPLAHKAGCFIFACDMQSASQIRAYLERHYVLERFDAASEGFCLDWEQAVRAWQEPALEHALRQPNVHQVPLKIKRSWSSQAAAVGYERLAECSLSPEHICFMSPNHYGHIRSMATMLQALLPRFHSSGTSWQVDLLITGKLGQPFITWLQQFTTTARSHSVSLRVFEDRSALWASYIEDKRAPASYILDHFYMHEAGLIEESVHPTQRATLRIVAYCSTMALHWTKDELSNRMPACIHGLVIASTRSVESRHIQVLEADMKALGKAVWPIGLMSDAKVNAFSHCPPLPHIGNRKNIIFAHGTVNFGHAPAERAVVIAKALRLHVDPQYQYQVLCPDDPHFFASRGESMHSLPDNVTLVHSAINQPVEVKQEHTAALVHHLLDGGPGSFADVINAGIASLAMVGTGPDQAATSAFFANELDIPICKMTQTADHSKPDDAAALLAAKLVELKRDLGRLTQNARLLRHRVVLGQVQDGAHLFDFFDKVIERVRLALASKDPAYFPQKSV